MVYSKPRIERFGTFREITRWGLSSASDGGSILGIGTSPGCSTSIGSYTIVYGCPTDGPTSS